MKTKVLQMTSAALIILMLGLALFSATAVMEADSITANGLSNGGPYTLYDGTSGQAAPQMIAEGGKWPW